MVRHVLKNAAPGMLAVMGLQFGYLMGGSILVEPVFAWPGSGQLLGRAIVNRDVPVLQGAILCAVAGVRRDQPAWSTCCRRRSTRGCGGPDVAGDVAAADGADERGRRRAGLLGHGAGGGCGGDPVTVVFGLLMLAIVLAAVFAPLLAPFDPYKESIILRLKPFGYRGHCWARTSWGGTC